MAGWALDLGTTNSGLARWDDRAERPELVELADICRRPGGEDHLEAPRLVPSATHVIDEDDVWAKLGRWPFLARRVFWGKLAHIGRVALDMNSGRTHAAYAPTFKAALGREPMRPLVRLAGRPLTAREVAYRFVRELLCTVKNATGERLRSLVVTTPVEAYETYRAEVLRLMNRLGVKTVRFLDEPVAAALGYGLGMAQRRRVLVVDFGGGTLNMAVVALSAKEVQAGAGEVLAKTGRGTLGGNQVDRWLLQAFCQRLDYALPDDTADEELRFWHRIMLDEARRVKEAVFFAPSDNFVLMPPEELRRFEARIRGAVERPLDVTREDVVGILKERRVYDEMMVCVGEIEAQLAERSLGLDDVDDVLMVGGSTLLPGVYPLFEERFGRDRVRAWQPFEAVAYGASAFAGEHFVQGDFIVHDYAFVTYDAKTHEKEYTLIVRKGTRFPTAPDQWKRQLVPSCSLGEPETQFKLVICEIGRDDAGERQFGWDAQGQVHKLGGRAGESQLIVPLNEGNPTLGFLEPPHAPSDRRPRLEISFGVNSDRWLCATVKDLFTHKVLMRDESVVRLL